MNNYRGSRKELADLIASVQEHPLTPPILRDNILDALVASHHQMDYASTPEGIELCLASSAREQEVLRRRFSGKQ